MAVTSSSSKEMKTGVGSSASDGQQALGRLWPIEPVRIVPKDGLSDEALKGTIKWIEESGYKVVVRRISARYAPFNTIIRARKRDAKGEYRYYLAEIER